MRFRHPISTSAGLLLASVVVLGVSASSARAQFPVFYGGQVLTPFGNRGSDGSYRYPSTTRSYGAPRGYSRVVPASRTYYAPQRMYYQPQRMYYTPYPGQAPYATPGRAIYGYRR